MKRRLSLMAALVMIFCSVSALAEAVWICPICGSQAEGNSCDNCGYQAGSTFSVRTAEDLIRLDLDIGFEKNTYSSTYDVKMFVDEEFVAVLDHGESYKGSIAVTPGSHTISFQRANKSRINNSRIFVVEEPSRFSCVIHAKMNRIEITGERMEKIDDGDPLPGEGPIYVNGELLLTVKIEFKRNLKWSKYDVDMYVDDQLVATLPHGNDFQGVLGVSEGNHVIMFCKSGDKKINGTTRFSVAGDATFSCKIVAKDSEVKVSKESIR